MPREYTCGTFLLNANNELLITHPTGARDDAWSVPKGRQEEGETFNQAAERELWEETGVNGELLRMGLVLPIKEFPAINYRRRRKTLIPFLYKISGLMHDFPFYCLVHVGESGPENDAFRWVNLEDAKQLIHYTQAQALCEIENFLIKNESI